MQKLDFILITNRKVCEIALIEIITQAIEGGISAVQLREKDLSTKDLYMLAKKLREITKRLGVNFVINDRVDIALAVDADGVHLGWQSLDVGIVRKMIGQEKLIGFSAHNLQEAKKASIEGVDYISISPIFGKSCKDYFMKPLGVIEMRKIKEQVDIPVVALGGINEANVTEVLEHGADGVAVISAIFLSKNPKQTASRLYSEIKKFKTRS